MKRKRVPFLIVLLLAFCLSWTVSAAEGEADSQSEKQTEAQQETEPANGYVTVDGQTFYYKDGVEYTGLAEVNGSTCYFVSGVLQKSSWYTSESGAKYYFKASGQMATGKVKISGSYYYFNAKGVMVVSKRVKVDGYYYYFGSNGKMVKAKKVKINNNYYYFNTAGKMVTGMKKINGYYYYFTSSGKMVTGLKKINGNYYYFKESGKMKTGWMTDSDGNQYYFDKKTGIRATGKQIISHYIRYFNSKGVLYRSVDMNKKMVALTYDDGPSANTATILNTLERYDAVATFFVVGNRVSSYSSTVKRAYKMGCEIGNHTWSHATLTSLSSSAIASQISQTNAAVKAITGVSPVVMRPPGGGYNSTVRSSVGMPLILWSIDTRDWATHSSASTISAVLNYVKDGDIVLMHDLYSWTASASQTIIPSLISRGYQLVTVSELAECRGGMKSGSVYSSFR